MNKIVQLSDKNRVAIITKEIASQYEELQYKDKRAFIENLFNVSDEDDIHNIRQACRRFRRYEKLKDDFLFLKVNGGSFMNHICEAIMLADSENTELLYKAYPDLVNGYYLYHLDKMYREEE